MDWKLAIEREREVLKGIVALFCALAALTDSLCGRSHPVRRLVLWILKPGLAIALDCIAIAGPLGQAFTREASDSLAEARRYSRCFRAAARSVKRSLKALNRCEAGERALPALFDSRLSGHEALFASCVVGRDRLISLCNLVAAQTGLPRYALATGPPVPDRRDAS